MLAPLKNRDLLEREPEDSSEQRINDLESENTALQQALRVTRSSQKRIALRNSNHSIEQTNRISALEIFCKNYRNRISELESGQAIIELGRQLMEAKETNQKLLTTAQRVLHLDENISLAHRECERLARERDSLALRLYYLTDDLLS